VEASTTTAWAEVVAGIQTGEAPRDPGQGVDTAVAAASGAGEVIPLQLLQLVQYINLNTLLDIDTGFNVFFYLLQVGILCHPTDVFFCFFDLKRKMVRSRGFYFSSREGFYPLRP
jgi:hypothetical protein